MLSKPYRLVVSENGVYLSKYDDSNATPSWKIVESIIFLYSDFESKIICEASKFTPISDSLDFEEYIRENILLFSFLSYEIDTEKSNSLTAKKIKEILYTYNIFK